MMKFIEKLLAVRPYRLTLQFNTGEIRVADLEPTLRAKGTSAQSAYAQLFEPATFARARLDAESRTVCWDGLAREITAGGTEKDAPLDLCPDVLYEISTPSPQQDQSASAGTFGYVLKDEPPSHE
jgi:hypothetical protein